MINLKGKKVFIIGVGDDQGFGFSIAKTFFEKGADILLGTWVPIFNIFSTSWEKGKFDSSRKLSNGQLMDIKKIYPIDVMFDKKEDVPEEIRNNKRYINQSNYTIEEIAREVAKDFGKIDIVIHTLANAPEIKNSLLNTSRQGYLSALSASSYSFVSLANYLSPIMNKEGSFINLTYLASNKVVPGYGGGMSTAKAALESDTKTLAWELGRKYGIRINSISAGPLRSRAAKAIGMIDNMIKYSKANAPLQKDLSATDVANAALFLSCNMASAITGHTLYVDNGLNIMGIAEDSQSLL